MASNNRIRKGNNFAGGINTGVTPINLADNESTDEVGFDTDNYPALTTRKGRTSYGTTGSAATWLLANYGNTHLVRAVGTALQYNSTGTTWTAISGTFTAADWDYTNFDIGGTEVLIITNGTDDVKYWNGSALANLNAADAPKGKYITSDVERVWIAQGDSVHFSASLTATDWTTSKNSGTDQFYTTGGGDITAITNYNDQITVFKKNAMGVYFGDNYFNQKLVTVSNDIGCVSFKTLVEVGDTLFWLGQNDIYAYGGGKPKPIGQRVRSYLDDINTTHLSKCCAFTDGLRYYLCLVTGSDTEPDTRLVYDPRYDIWRVPGEDESFRYGAQLNNVLYAGDDGGQTYKVNDGTDDDGTAISASVTSKPFNEQFPEAKREYRELHLQGYFPSGTTLTPSVSTEDRGSTFTAISPNPSTTSTVNQNKDMLIDLSVVDHTSWFRYKLEVTGPVDIYEAQRYFKQLKVQR